MHYAVAYLDLFDNDLGMAVVVASNPIDAIIKGVKRIADSGPDFDDWLTSFNLQMTIKEIKQEFADCDRVVSVMAI